MSNKNIPYKDQQALKNNEKANEILMSLPPYVRRFAESYTNNHAQSSTVLAYVRDIDVFFYYLAKQCNYENPLNVRLSDLENLDVYTIDGYKGFLNLYTRYDAHIGRQVVHKNSADAINRKLVSLKKFYEYLYKTDLISRNPADKVSFVKSESGHELKTVLGTDEVDDLVNCVTNGSDKTSLNIKRNDKGNHLRDKAIILLFCNTGMRVSELVGLNTDDVDYDRHIIRIVRKGHMKAQEIHVHEGVLLSIRDYCENERRSCPDDPAALFVSRKGQRLTVRSVERLVSKYGALSGAGRSTTPHTLRRSYGTALYEKSSDIKMVSDRLGHRNIQTANERYVRQSAAKDAEAADIDPY